MAESETSRQLRIRARLPGPGEAAALGLFGLSVLLLVSLLLDPPRPLAGGGFFLSRGVYAVLGVGTYLLLAFTGFWGAVLFFRQRVSELGLKFLGVLLAAVALAVLPALLVGDPLRELHLGGYVGAAVRSALEGLSPWLTVPLVGVVLVAGLIFATDWGFLALRRGGGRQAGPAELGPSAGLTAAEAADLAAGAAAMPPPAAPPPVLPQEPQILRRIEPVLEDVQPAAAEPAPPAVEREPDEAAPTRPAAPRLNYYVREEETPEEPVPQREEEEEEEAETPEEPPAAPRPVRLFVPAERPRGPSPAGEEAAAAEAPAVEDPFRDAPVAAGGEPPVRRRRQEAAAEVEEAMEGLLPSLDRVKRKIADLEEEPQHP